MIVNNPCQKSKVEKLLCDVATDTMVKKCRLKKEVFWEAKNCRSRNASCSHIFGRPSKSQNCRAVVLLLSRCLQSSPNEKPVYDWWEGHIVQIDESLMARVKNHTGRVPQQRCVFGGIEVVTKDCCLVFVEKRSAEVLLPLNERYIAPGSINLLRRVALLPRYFCVTSTTSIWALYCKPQSEICWSSHRASHSRILQSSKTPWKDSKGPGMETISLLKVCLRSLDPSTLSSRQT